MRPRPTTPLLLHEAHVHAPFSFSHDVCMQTNTQQLLPNCHGFLSRHHRTTSRSNQLQFCTNDRLLLQPTCTHAPHAPSEPWHTSCMHPEVQGRLQHSSSWCTFSQDASICASRNLLLHATLICCSCCAPPIRLEPFASIQHQAINHHMARRHDMFALRRLSHHMGYK